MTDSDNPGNPVPDGPQVQTGQGTWLLLETLGLADGIDPTVVADGSRKRNFASPGRSTRSRVIQNSLRELVAAVVARAERVEFDVVDRGAATALVGEPVLSARGEVFGVAAWVGPAGTIPPERDVVGSFAWNAVTRTTEHGPGLESKILGIAETTDRRTLPEIWKYFTEFDYHDEYTAFVHQVEVGEIESGQEFAAEISLIGEDGGPRRVHMTVRSRMSGNDRRVIGLVHCIADSERPPSAFAREFARTAATLAVDSGDGLGHLLLRTGLVLEWLRVPATPFDRWATEVPEIHPTSATEFDSALADLGRGTVPSIDLVIYLRFAGDEDWLPAHITVTAVGHPGTAGPIVSQGLIQVRTSYGIMAW